MSPPSNDQYWDLLKEVRDAVAEQGKCLALTQAAAERTEQAVDGLRSDMTTVQGQTKAALARVAEMGRSLDADPSAAGWWYRSGPLAWLRRWPKPLVTLLGLAAIGLAYGLDAAVRAGVIQLGIPAGVLPPVGGGS